MIRVPIGGGTPPSRFEDTATRYRETITQQQFASIMRGSLFEGKVVLRDTYSVTFTRASIDMGEKFTTIDMWEGTVLKSSVSIATDTIQYIERTPVHV